MMCVHTEWPQIGASFSQTTVSEWVVDIKTLRPFNKSKPPPGDVGVPDPGQKQSVLVSTLRLVLLTGGINPVFLHLSVISSFRKKFQEEVVKEDRPKTTSTKSAKSSQPPQPSQR